MGISTCRCPHAPFSARAFHEAETLFGRRTFLSGALATFAGMTLLGRRAAAAENVIVLKAARMFDGTTIHSPGVCVVRDDRIVSLSAGDAGSDARVLDFGDATLMPGLIDAHTHVSAGAVTSYYLHVFDTPDQPSGDSVAEAAILSVRNAQALLRNGFTTVRDVGGGNGIDLAMRNAIARGFVVGPRILAAGTALSITGGHGDLNSLPDDVKVERPTGVAYGPYGFREQVREHIKHHVDVIKILATGGVLSYGDVWNVPQFNLDEIQAVVDEATKFGRRVSAHAHGDPGIALAVEGGCHSIEHGTGVSEKTLHAMAQRGTYLVPTIWALDSILQPGNPNKIPADSLAKAHAIGVLRNEGMQRALAASVKFAYGTDAGVFPHKENNKDFALLASMGMKPVDLLRSATSMAADLLGTTDRGRIAAGNLADIVAFHGDPSTNISALESRPALVMIGGKEIPPDFS
jgi:imidazolonepropionase-like amidohydrolase